MQPLSKLAVFVEHVGKMMASVSFEPSMRFFNYYEKLRDP
jgi:hypothetical protein